MCVIVIFFNCTVHMHELYASLYNNNNNNNSGSWEKLKLEFLIRVPILHHMS